MFPIEGKIHRDLLMLVKDAAPRETGGIIVDGKEIHCLHNYADPADNTWFEFHLDELKTAVRAFGMGNAGPEGIGDRVVLWHSHPGGGVGPSREDMQNRTPLKYHLVVALREDDIVSTWY